MEGQRMLQIPVEELKQYGNRNIRKIAYYRRSARCTAALTMITRQLREGDALFVAGDFGFVFWDNRDEHVFWMM